jgi:lactoylglutathione lyase
VYIYQLIEFTMHNLIQIIGLISAFLTTAAFVPQAIKTWRTRSTSDLSPLMFSLFCLGIAGWLVYGILKNDLPIILANVVTICFAGSILFFIIAGDRSVSISHAGLYVSDLEMMKEFYKTNFKANTGKNYNRKSGNFSSCFLSFGGNARLELMHAWTNAGEAGEVQQTHLSFSVGSKEQVDLYTARLKAWGVKVKSEPRTTGDGYYESVIYDPEGNLIEICA